MNELSSKVIKNGNFCNIKNYSRVFTKEEIEKLNLNFGKTLAQKIYNIENNIKSNPLCPVCKKNLEFKSFKEGYKTFCCKECHNKSLKGKKLSLNYKEKIKKGIENHFEEKYGKGIKNPFQVKEIKEKIYSKRNSDFYKKRKVKTEKTNLERYGKKEIGQVESIINKRKKTNLEKYGNTCALHGTNQEKTDKIFEEKFGKNGLQKKMNESRAKRTSLRFLNKLKKYMQENNLELISNYTKKYTESGANLFKFHCNKCGKDFLYSLHNGLPVCRKCYPIKVCVSNEENEVADYISSIYNKEILRNKRDIIYPKELDIYLPDINFAIEYDGIYWHSDGKRSELKKYNLCKEKNINIIFILDLEWREKENIIKSILNEKLGIRQNVIYARKCVIKEISVEEYKNFCEENHIQGYSPASVKLGLFYNDILLQITSFSKPRFNKKYEWEMIRECSKSYYSIVGGKQKLLKYFERNYKPKSIISYCDKRYFNGISYINCGFKELKDSPPNYFYSRGNALYNRIGFQKSKLKEKLNKYDDTLTEKENMLMNGYKIIYDCGNKVFEKVY